MSEITFNILVTLAALGCGLVGGIFFAFSTFIMKALKRLPPYQGIESMQAINITVINPWLIAVKKRHQVLNLEYLNLAIFKT